MAEDKASAARPHASSTGNGTSALSNLRQRPLGRASTFADISNPSGRRRSSIISDSIDGTQQSIRSSTDNLLLPKAHGSRYDASEEPSNWHSAPLALALLPAVGGLLFKDGSAVVTDVTLLGLAAVFLNWSVRVPWDWYTSARSYRVQDSEASDDFYASDAIIEESSEDEHEDELSSPKGRSKASPSKKHSRQQSTARDSAAEELRLHELLALLACFLFPILGAWMLHAIRGKLSRPSEGLVSNYNLAIFLLAAELRPLIHLIKLGQSRTLHLQRVVNAVPEADKPDKERVLDMSKRLEELEAHVAGASTEAGSGGANAKVTAQATAEVRRALQPDLDALNRAVRRYEKRATILTMQTESRLQDLEARMNDAITLAAAAERSKHDPGQGASAILFQWFLAAMVLPIQASWEFISLPARVSSKVLAVAKSMIGGKVEKEMRTAGRHSEPGRMAGSRPSGRGIRKVA